MAAVNCMCKFLSGPSRIDSRPPAARANPDLPVAPSASICSPRTNGWDSPSLRWDRRCDVRHSQEKRGLSLHCRASIIGQQGESGALSGEDSSPSGSSVGLVQAPRNAAEIVQEFYDMITQRDYIGVANLFTEDCEYEDFQYSDTTRGREEVLKFFQKMMSSLSTELKFVIDDMTRDDPNAVGVLWHMDWRGKALPLSRGCSFYRCVVNSAGQRQIRFARDIVEPATKPGGVAVGALKLVTFLFERFPQLADALHPPVWIFLVKQIGYARDSWSGVKISSGRVREENST